MMYLCYFIIIMNTDMRVFCLLCLLETNNSVEEYGAFAARFLSWRRQSYEESFKRGKAKVFFSRLGSSSVNFKVLVRAFTDVRIMGKDQRFRVKDDKMDNEGK